MEDEDFKDSELRNAFFIFVIAKVLKTSTNCISAVVCDNFSANRALLQKFDFSLLDAKSPTQCNGARLCDKKYDVDG